MAKRRAAAATEDRLSRLMALRTELALAAGISLDSITPNQKLKLEHACWTSLQVENLRAAILEGQIVEVTATERLVAALNDLCPQRPQELIVKLVSGAQHCSKCDALIKAEAPIGELTEVGFEPANPPCAPVCADDRLNKSVTGSIKSISGASSSANAPAPAAASAPASSNVTPLYPEPEPPTSVAGMVAKVNSVAGRRSPFDVPFGTRFDNR